MYGDVVRRARQARRLTQRQLAEISGIEQSNISAIEHGRREPTAGTLHRLLTACGFELLAVAGPRVVAFPPPGEGGPVAGEQMATSAGSEQIPMATRVRLLTNALELAEAVVRSR